MTVDRGDTDPTAQIPEEDSGTGWPDDELRPDGGQTHDTLPMHRYRTDRSRADRTRTVEQALVDRAAARRGTPRDDEYDDDRPAERRRRRRWIPFAGTGRRLFWLAAIAGVIAILVLVGSLFGLFGLANPFKARTIDRSQPVLLVSIENLSRFEAASGNFQVVIDVQEDRQFIPDILFSKRSLFVAAGTVDAYVDFTNIGNGAIKVDPTNAKAVTVTLPAPQLEPANIDVNRSYVYAVQEGLINKASDLFGAGTNDSQELYQLAQQKINAAALDSELRQRAADNTKAMLVSMLKSLGYTTVVVNFPPIS